MLLRALILLPLIICGCSGNRPDSYVKRHEFNVLTKRVDTLEETVGLRGGNLASTVSGQSSARPEPVAVADYSDGLLPPAGQAAPAPAAAAPAVKAAGNDKADYQQAQNLLKQKKYSQAASIFEQMLARNPSGSLAPNARYWLGECHYAEGRYRQAAVEFLRCAEDYPKSAKAPDSLLKLSYCYDRLGDGPKAMAVMNALLSQYPGSEAAAMVKSGRSRFSG